MHAYALEILKNNLLNGKSCLDVGSGSGYLTLAFAKMMEMGKLRRGDDRSMGCFRLLHAVVGRMFFRRGLLFPLFSSITCEKSLRTGSSRL